MNVRTEMTAMQKSAAMAVALLCAAVAFAETMPPLPEGAFTYAVIPDTQGYDGEGRQTKRGRAPGEGPTRNEQFDAAVDWLVANAEKERIVFVTHTGDITDMNNDAQWRFASNAMSRLDGKIPYSVSPGNHDMKRDGDTSLFNRYFPASRYAGNDWYAATFPGFTNSAGLFVSGGNANSICLFEYGGEKFAVATLECNAPDPVLEWAAKELERRPGRHVIVATHQDLGAIHSRDARLFANETKKLPKKELSAYNPDLSKIGRLEWCKCHGKDGNSGKGIWDKFTSRLKDAFLVVSGDQGMIKVARVDETGRAGNMVHSLMQDTGYGLIRIFRFIPAEKVVRCYTINPRNGGELVHSFWIWRDDKWFNFELPYPGSTPASPAAGPAAPADDPIAARKVEWSGVSNARDLGGLPGMGGRRVKRGLVYRSSGLNANASYREPGTKKRLPRSEWKGPGRVRISPEAKKHVVETLGVRTDLDLRNDGETFKMTGSPLGDEVRWVHVQSYEYATLGREKGRAAFVDDFKVFLAETNYPIVFHCIAGADRTGSLAAILNGLLGVDPDLLHRDWQYTWTGQKKPAAPPEERWDGLMSAMSGFKGATLNERMENYVLSCGFSPRDIAKFRDIMLEPMCAETHATSTVYTTGFDTPAGADGWKWKDDAMWRVEEGAGIGGSPALVWTNDDPTKLDICYFEIPGVSPGQSYRAEFKVKAYSHKGSLIEGTICWKDGEKWLGGAGGCAVRWDDRRIKPDKDGWCQMAVCTTPFLPPTATRGLMQLYVKPGGIGRVAFDDIRIYRVGERPVGFVGGFVSSCYRNTAVDGDVKFVVCMETPREYWEAGKTVAELSYLASDGSERTVRMDVPDEVHAEKTLPVSDLAMGRNTVAVTVKGADGRVFGVRTLEFERVAAIPERRVWIDRHGRTIVEGKPFFPLGMFWSIGTLENYPDAFDRYATGPFNCLQNYDHTLRAKELDRFWAKGLRVIVGVKDVFAPIAPNIAYEGKQGGVRRGANPKKGTVLKTWADEDRYLTDMANALRDHPGFLGWYICDEFRGEFRDRLRQHYELLKAVDPGHPSCASILADRSSARNFIDCLDVFWVDSYSIAAPVTNGGSKTVTEPDSGEAWIAADRIGAAGVATYGVLRSWGVGQAFAHKWDHPDRYVPNRELHRFPTFKELKSQVWQEIAAGANGIIFYSYAQLLWSKETPEKKEEYFRRTCDVAKEIRDQMPILTLEPGPAVAAKPKRVRVRTWRAGDAVYALVCNTHPEPRKGVVRIDGKWKAGVTVFGDGASFADGAIALDMLPLGVAIVRLEGATL